MKSLEVTAFVVDFRPQAIGPHATEVISMAGRQAGEIGRKAHGKIQEERLAGRRAARQLGGP